MLGAQVLLTRWLMVGTGHQAHAAGFGLGLPNSNLELVLGRLLVDNIIIAGFGYLSGASGCLKFGLSKSGIWTVYGTTYHNHKFTAAQKWALD